MRPDEVLAEVRSVLHAPPSPQAWEALCRWVDRCSGPALERVLMYAGGALRLWPDDLRVLPKTWLQRTDNPRRKLARAFDSGVLRRRDLKKFHRWLDGLDLTALRWGFAGKLLPELYTVLAHPSFQGLRILDLRELHLVDVSKLEPALRELSVTDLRLGANPELSDDALFSLLRSCGEDLAHVNLDGHYFRHGLLERVRAQSARPTLRSLSLVGCHAKAESRDAGMVRMRELGTELGRLYGVTPSLVAELPTPEQGALARVLGQYIELPRQGWLAPEARRQWALARELLLRLDPRAANAEEVLGAATPEARDALWRFIYADDLRYAWWDLDQFIEQVDMVVAQFWMEAYDRGRHVLELRLSEAGDAEFGYWGRDDDGHIEERGQFSLDEEQLLLRREEELTPLRIKIHLVYSGTQIRYRGRVLTRVWGHLPPSGEEAFGGVDWDAWLSNRYNSHHSMYYLSAWE